jgi:predicted porin
MKQLKTGGSPMVHPMPDELSGSFHTLLKKSLVVAVIAGSMVFTTAAQAIEFKISGQVSRMIVMPDDALGDEIQFQDIGWSGSRWRITGSQEFNDGMKAGFRLEQQIQSNSSSSTDGGAQVDGGNDDAIDNRYQDIWFSGDFGKIAIGKGDGAANGSTEADLSGTALSSSSNHQDNWGNYNITPGQDWDSVFTMQDGLSRVNRLRYDTPALNRIRLAFSIGQGSETEIGLKYTGTWDGNRLDARAFIVDTDNFTDNVGPNVDIFGYSASYLMASGFNVTIAFADVGRPAAADNEAFTVKVGYKQGIHAYTIDIGDGSTGANDADTFGLTYAAVLYEGIEIFATIRELDSNVAGSTSVDILAVGSRIKF